MLFDLVLPFLLYNHLFEQMSTRSHSLLAAHTTHLNQFSSLSCSIVFKMEATLNSVDGMWALHRYSCPSRGA